MNAVELLGIAELILIISLIIVLVKKVGISDKPKILEDYMVIKKALVEYHKTKMRKVDNINLLKDFVKPDFKLDWSRYSVTSDEKYLVVSDIENLDCEAIIDLVGGTSRVEENLLYLSFFKYKAGDIEPVAVITMTPNHDITTTTHIKWSSSESQVNGGEIRQEDWGNKSEVYSQPGMQTVSLRVMDRNKNWSQWTSVEFEVVEVGGISEIQAGSEFMMVLYKSGKIAAIGDNTFGQLGTGAQSTLNELTLVPNYQNVEQIACGETHVLYKDFQGNAWCVGSNDYGQLGFGSRMNLRTPQKLLGLDRVKQLAAGKDISAAVLMTGAILVWGTNEKGQLGEERPLFREEPYRIKNLSNVKSVSLGHTHMVCVHQDGMVSAWGDNSYGQVGSGSDGQRMEPTIINVKNVKQAVAGKDFTIVLTEKGKVLGWGSNLYGQLGIEGITESDTPKEIPKLKNISKIAGKGQFVLALSDSGEVFTWGRYAEHKDKFYPNPVVIEGLKSVKDIAASYGRAYALTEEDEIFTWRSQIDLPVPLSEHQESEDIE